MAVAENTENIILSSMASYQTMNILELMAMTPSLSDPAVRKMVAAMEARKLVVLSGEGTDQVVSMTSKGYDHLKSHIQCVSESMQCASD